MNLSVICAAFCVMIPCALNDALAAPPNEDAPRPGFVAQCPLDDEECWREIEERKSQKAAKWEALKALCLEDEEIPIGSRKCASLERAMEKITDKTEFAVVLMSSHYNWHCCGSKRRSGRGRGRSHRLNPDDILPIPT